MKNISFVFVTQCTVLWLFLLDLNSVLVSCQGTAVAGGAMSVILRNMLAQVPVKILSLVQLGLLARLLNQRSNRVAPGLDGLDNDRDGFIDEDDESALDSNRKNVMIFMGRHNIQVSNHGIQKGEEGGVGGEGDEGFDDEEDDYDDDDDDSEDESDDEEDNYTGNNNQGNKYKNKKNKKGKAYGEGEEDEDKYNKHKTKTNTDKQSTKPSYDNGKGEGEGPNYQPTIISLAKSKKKPKQKLIPWFKKLLQSNEKIAPNDGKKNNKVDPNIMALPNGFPIGGSKLEHFSRRSDDSLEDLMEYLPSEDQLNELLSNPQIIDLLFKLNESLANESKNDLKRSKRQLIDSNQSLVAQESRHSKRTKPSSKQSFNLKEENHSYFIPDHLKKSTNYYSSFNSMNGPKSASTQPSSDFESESRVEPFNRMLPKKSSKSYHLRDYMTFKPLAPKYKTSSSMFEPSFGQMHITDDDEYKGPDYGSHLTSEMYGGGMHGDTNVYGKPEEMNTDLPVMDLTYWNKAIKKTIKKKKKKYATTEAPTSTTEEPDYDYGEEDEDEEEEEAPLKKTHTTIQVIKSGSKTGNIGLNSGDDECCNDESPRGWARLPGFRKLFGRG